MKIIETGGVIFPGFFIRGGFIFSNVAADDEVRGSGFEI